MKITALALIALLSTSARAQHNAVNVPVDIVLARLCVSEAGWQNENDCPAIVYIIRTRAARTGRTLVEMARAYSGRALDPTRTDSRKWVAHLNEHATQPIGWPRGTSWPRYRRAWIDTLERVSALLEGPPRNPCATAVDHWAGRGVDRSHIWQRVDCGPMAHNYYWRVPRDDRD